MQHRSFCKRLISIVSFLILSILCLLCIFQKIHPTGRDSYHARLLEEMEQASSFSDFTDSLFRYEVTSDSITTAYTLKDPSTYRILELPTTLTTFKKNNQMKRPCPFCPVNWNGLIVIPWTEKSRSPIPCCRSNSI